MKINFSRFSAISMTSFVSSVVIVLLISSLFIACNKEDEKYVPTISTATVTDITTSSATAGGEITDNGGADVIASGVVYSLTSGATLSNSFTTDGTTSGTFTSYITGLTANTTYYVRAYATNSAGTSYGTEVSFTTLP